MVWVIWTEQNNRIFNHRAMSFIDLFHSILFFVEFWAGPLSLPKKHKVDTGLLTYARKKCRGSSDSLRACAISLNTALVPVRWTCSRLWWSCVAMCRHFC